jgi:HDOD domain
VTRHTSLSSDIVTANDLIKHLSGALKSGGDFPVSARIAHHVAELTQKTSSSARDISAVILKDPTLAVRVLQIANSSLFLPAKPITSIAQAVVLLGMVQLSELCTSLVLLERFVPLVRQEGHFARALHRAIKKSIISSVILKILDKKHLSETGHLSGMLSEIGPLLFAFYYPSEYEKVARRKEERLIDFSTGLLHLYGITSTQLSRALSGELHIPLLYEQILSDTDSLLLKPTRIMQGRTCLPLSERHRLEEALSLRSSDINSVVTALVIASKLSYALGPHSSVSVFNATIQELSHDFGVATSFLHEVLTFVPKYTSEFCATLEVEPPIFPDFFTSLMGRKSEDWGRSSSESVAIDTHLQEMRDALEEHQPISSLITIAMEALLHSLHFDRVIYLCPELSRKTLIQRISLGTPPPDSSELPSLSLVTDSGAAIVRAFVDGKSVTRGVPQCSDARSFVALPVGARTQVLGVIYADRGIPPSSDRYYKEVAAITSLEELLSRARAL